MRLLGRIVSRRAIKPGRNEPRRRAAASLAGTGRWRTECPRDSAGSFTVSHGILFRFGVITVSHAAGAEVMLSPGPRSHQKAAVVVI